MPESMFCPFCKSEIRNDAAICASCGERVVGKECEDCKSLCPHDATKCRWCGYKFRESTKRIGIKEFSIQAKLLPTLLIRLRLIPQRARFNDEKLVISTPGFFWLWTNDAEVPWNKIAGFDYRSGIIWDAVKIETKGQDPTTIRCLAKQDGQRLRAILQALEE